MSIGSWLNWPRTATVLAVSYLVPWAWENVKGIQIRSRALSRRRRGMARRTPRNNGNDNVDCGARQADQGPVVPASVALRNMLGNTPDRLVVNEGDVCSICLDEFTAEVITVGLPPHSFHCACLYASDSKFTHLLFCFVFLVIIEIKIMQLSNQYPSGGQAASDGLRNLQPPICALCCGKYLTEVILVADFER